MRNKSYRGNKYIIYIHRWFTKRLVVFAESVESALLHVRKCYPKHKVKQCCYEFQIV